jgi:hypothetical protein
LAVLTRKQYRKYVLFPVESGTIEISKDSAPSAKTKAPSHPLQVIKIMPYQLVITPASVPAQVQNAPIGCDSKEFSLSHIALSKHQTVAELGTAISRIRSEGWEQIVIANAAKPNEIVKVCSPNELLQTLVGLPVQNYVLTEY